MTKAGIKGLRNLERTWAEVFKEFRDAQAQKQRVIDAMLRAGHQQQQRAKSEGKQP
jgi:hypothetical protein